MTDKATESQKVSGAHAAKSESKAKGFFALNPMAGYIATAVVSLVLGLLIGSFFLGGPSSAIGSATVSESQLDTAIATYSYKGTHKVTIRELMEAQGSVDLFKTTDAEGNEVYRVPASDSVTSYVRSQIIGLFADSKGITVSDDEVFEALKKAYNVEGDENIEALAKQFGVTTDKLKELIGQQLKTEKLLKSFMEETEEVPALPAQPEAPEKGKEQEASEKYAEYIRNAVGGAWDDANKKWADENSAFAKTLVGDTAFDGTKATFTQANIVFSILSQEHQEKTGRAQATAMEEINNAMASASITIRTLAQ